MGFVVYAFGRCGSVNVVFVTVSDFSLLYYVVIFLLFSQFVAVPYCSVLLYWPGGDGSMQLRLRRGCLPPWKPVSWGPAAP